MKHTTETDHPLPPKAPVHEPWDFCARCFCEEWNSSEKPTHHRTIVNIYPFATELRRWMKRETINLPIISLKDLYIENPFCHHASWLIVIFADVLNDFADFIKKRDSSLTEPWKIDLKRMRISSELILYAVRICEALFKQLLYCTQFNPKRYRNKALGQLLIQPCRACKGQMKHDISLAGSLAHRYRLCGQYEQCLREDLKYLNNLRNSLAAHATVDQKFLSRTVKEAWQLAEKCLGNIGNKFSHMLKHISEIELAMIKEANYRLHFEDRNGKYNSNLASTYYWQNSLQKFHSLLCWKIAKERLTIGRN